MKSLTLLPNTGVQYVVLGELNDAGTTPLLFSEEELRSHRKVAFQVKSVVREDLKEVAVPKRRDSGDDDDDENEFLASRAQTRMPEDGVPVAAAPKVALECASSTGGWLPLPFDVPDVLCGMIWLERRSKGYEAILAFDTTVTPRGEGGTLAPRQVDQEFGIHASGDRTFWGHPAVANFVCDRQEALAADSRASNIDSPGKVQAHLASLYSFLADLQKQGRIPTINLVGARQEPVDVSLIVDLGNSRTCCVIMETNAEGGTSFHRLKLRDPERPDELFDQPAQTRLAFVPPTRGVLGDDVLAFEDLSIVRFGKPAVDILGASNLDVGARGMSSPKRYMWDSALRATPWQVAGDEEASGSTPIHGPLLRRIHPKKPFAESDGPEDARPQSPAYPRKAGAMFALIEILEQAYRQVNSVEHRGAWHKREGYTRRRVISDVVAMHPGGMHSREVADFHRAIERGAQLWAEYRTDPEAFATGEPIPRAEDDGLSIVKLPLEPNIGHENPPVPKPNILQICDEGLAIQVCYLYGLTKDRFLDDTERLVTTMGRAREGTPSLRIASLDIGGGTTDLAIADYAPETEQKLGPARFQTNQRFYDGFSAGGDDVARAVLEELVFPAICEQMGISEEAWNLLFHSDSDAAATGTKARLLHDWSDFRRSLVPMVWLPLVHGCLQRLESEQPVDHEVAQLLLEVWTGKLDKLNHVLENFASGGAVKTVESVRVNIDLQDLQRIVRRTLGACLEQYCDLVGQFRCDALVLGGRSSALPAVRDLVHEFLPVPPGAVVFLHEQKFGEWFPFEENGRVGDSKTCGVVGAALRFLATHNTAGFVLKDLTEAGAVPSVLGVLNDVSGELRKGELFPQASPLSNEIGFLGGRVMIGSQRILHEFALARPTYNLTWNSFIAKRLRKAQEQQEVFITLRRDEETDDVVEVERVRGTLRYPDEFGEEAVEVDNDLVVSCKLQTLLDDDYWLDSGRFESVRAPETSAAGVGR